MSHPLANARVDTAPLGLVAEVTLGKMIQSSPVEGAELVPYIKAKNVRPEKVEVDSLGTMYATPAEREALAVRTGDIFVIEGGATAGRAAVVLDAPPEACIFQNAVHRVRSGPRMDQRFLYYMLAAYPQTGWYEAICSAATFKHLTGEKMARLPVPVPSLEVQRRVADMLDDETARIDALIAKNNDVLRLSDLRREATISLYVSGGMDARDPVEAFVEQPAMKHGWRLTKLKYVAQGVTVGIVVRPAELYVDSPEEGVPCLRGVNVKRGRVVDTDLRFIGHEGNAANPKSQLRRGDVVVVRTGEAGVAAVVPEWAWGGNCVDLLLVRTGPRLDPTFAEFVLNSDFVRRQVARGSVGSIQSHFNVASLSEAIVAVPEIEQQRMIVEDLQHRLAPLRRLREKVERQVELLNMRRRALITAALTGRINV